MSAIVPSVLPNSAEGIDNLNDLSKEWFRMLKVDALRSYLSAHGVPCSSQGKQYVKQKLVALSYETWRLKLEIPSLDEENVDDVILEKHSFDGHNLPLITKLSAGWTKCLYAAPEFSYADIYNYFVHKTGYDHENLKAYKGLDGYKLMIDGHVRSLLFQKTDQCSYFKFQVQPTERKKTWNGKDCYDCWTIISNSGEIISGYCNCYGGADGGCRHVAAGLFEIDRTLQIRKVWQQPSCTDQKCVWTQPAKKAQGAVPVKKMRLDKKASTTDPPIDHSLFDPRPGWAKGKSQLRQIQLQEILHKHCPDAVGLNVLGFNMPVSLDIIPPEDDANLLVEVTVGTCTSLTIKELVEDRAASSHEDLGSLLSSVQYKEEEREEIARSTISQSNNPIWFKHRVARITGSIAYTVCHRRESTDPKNLLEIIMAKKNSVWKNMPAPLEYGKNNEHKAIQLFIKENKKLHRDLAVMETGLHIFKSCVFLGASPDGIMTCSCCSTAKVVEVKCLWTHRTQNPKEAALAMRGYFDLDNAGKLVLRKETKWFYQMQMEMIATQLSTGVLVLYTDLGIESVLVEFDSMFSEAMTLKLKDFYLAFVVPHLVEELSCI